MSLVRLAKDAQEVNRPFHRAVDVVMSATGLLMLSPILILAAAVIKAHDGGPIFYRATRVGAGGNMFSLIKFRTMVVDAETRGAGITTSDDDRITPVGHFLRRTKIDELPQLLNVLAGEMSLVGPRPEDPRYVSRYTDVQLRVLAFRPGITSPASLKYRNESELMTGNDWEDVYLTQILPDKLRIELEYFPHRTLWSDISLMVRTVLSVAR